MIILLVGSFALGVALLVHEKKESNNTLRDILMVANITFGITLVIAGALEIMGYNP